MDFSSSLPYKPYCTDDFSRGLKILPLALALGKKYIQLNPPQMQTFLVFDIDRPGAALAAEDADLPAPTLTVVNPANKHAHMIYALAVPVCTSIYAKNKPYLYLEAIKGAYVQRLGSDPRYAGLISKNPWHPAWHTIEHGNAVYQLSVLADYVVLPSKKSRTLLRGNVLGRNCTLFDNLRFWAYRGIRDYWRSGGAEDWRRTGMQR
jgi:hypothetical protein